jgi:hypothetical protein
MKMIIKANLHYFDESNLDDDLMIIKYFPQVPTPNV